LPLYPHPFPTRRSSDLARFDALSRHYNYKLYTSKNPFLQQRAYYFPYKIDRELLPQTAKLLLGRQDFTSFSKRNTQTKTFLCTVDRKSTRLNSSHVKIS